MSKLKLIHYFSTKNSTSIDNIGQQASMHQSSHQMVHSQLTENNNRQMIDSNQQRRLSRAHEINLPEKNALPLENHSKTNESHYIKNKTLQSPVNRYKVNTNYF